MEILNNFIITKCLKMNEKLNSIYTGLIVGLIFPFVSAYIYQNIYFPSYDYLDFLFRLYLIGVYLKFISFCVFPNLLVFFISIWLNWLKTTRGILLATFMYAFVVYGLKFFA